MAPSILSRLFSLALGLVTLPVLALAQLCTGNSSEVGSLSYDIGSQDQLDFLAQNCTVIDARIRVSSNYTGPFVLRNVTNITKSIESSATRLSTLEFPDLVTFPDGLSAFRARSLTKLSFPELKQAGTLHVDEIGGLVDVEFPSLQNASGLGFWGDIERVSFPVLKSVRGRLLVCNAKHCLDEDSVNTTMTISFPALSRVHDFEVAGKLSSFEAPELATIDDKDGRSGTLRVDVWGQSQPPISLPKLKDLGRLGFFAGNFSSLSLPVLRNITYIAIAPDDPIDIDLPITSASEITMSGAITSVSLPNLQNFSRISVGSTAGIDCDSFLRTLNETTDNAAKGEYEALRCSNYGENRASMLQGLSSGHGTFVAITILLLVGSW
ncbi:uncharacterized protein BDV14DRAFT_167771 [Aspergillus stella-maris]|uniref:uncharacterized protein n=1 Tax=Aspergillus stella-maris TaxID=1810926 RepID=UPI003CCE4B7F